MGKGSNLSGKREPLRLGESSTSEKELNILEIMRKNGIKPSISIPSLTSRSVIKTEDPKGVVKWNTPEAISAERLCLSSWESSPHVPYIKILSDKALWVEWKEGSPLIERDMNQYAHAVGETMASLHQPAPSQSPHLRDALYRRQNLIKTNPDLSPEMKRYAQQKADILLEENMESNLLHGDLHGGNILVNEGKLSLIDPFGYQGDRAYDLAFYIASSPLATKDTVNQITAGYRCLPPRFMLWLQWLSVYKTDVALRKCPQDLPIAQSLVQFVRKLTTDE
jgi:hypothetical protein